MQIPREDSNLPRTIIIQNTYDNPKSILSKINHGEIESFKYDKNNISISFFSYLDLYLTAKNDLLDLSLHFQNDPLNLNVKHAFLCGATRCIKIDTTKFSHFQELAPKFGEIDEIICTDNIIIRFLNVISALKLAKYLFSNQEYKSKISFEPDPCATKKILKDQPRTVYIGGIQSNTTSEQIFNTIKGGYVFSLKVIKEKKCAFIVFIDPHSASAFIEYYKINDLVINNHRCKVSTGTETKLGVQNILQFYAGASRAIILANIIDKRRLEHDFGRFGEIEMINIIDKKNIVFINFVNLIDAYNAILYWKNDDYYKAHRIGFGKDRCGNENANDLMKLVVEERDKN